MNKTERYVSELLERNPGAFVRAFITDIHSGETKVMNKDEIIQTLEEVLNESGHEAIIDDDCTINIVDVLFGENENGEYSKSISLYIHDRKQ